MKFLIRDDDPCAFTTVEELERCYEGVWDYVPVNLSVTPFRIPGDDRNIPERYRGIERVMPLDENEELVALLSEKITSGKVSIALHGYHHAPIGGLAEYLAGEDLSEKTRKGKAYLEKLLQCTISTFVPPNNTIGHNGLTAIIESGLNLVGMPSFVRKRYRQRKLSNIGKYLLIKYYNAYHKSQYPYVLDVDGHKEVSFFSVTPTQTLAELSAGFDRMNRLDGVFIFATHYHAFDRRLKSGERIGDVLSIFLEKAAGLDNIQYCNYEQLWESTQNP